VIVVDVLISFGADPNCCDRWGRVRVRVRVRERVRVRFRVRP